MTTPGWYYVDRQQQRQGPVGAEAVAAAVARGEADDASLVWRDGLAQWQPLGTLREELGLPGAAPPAPPPAPAKSNTGCLIAAAIIVGGGVFLLFIISLLAAIALPAYQDYIGRSELQRVITGAAPAREALVAFVANTDRCPRDAEELGVSTLRIPGVDEIVAGSFEDGRCALELRLGRIKGLPAAEGARVWLAREDDGRVSCSGDEVLSRALPSWCR